MAFVFDGARACEVGSHILLQGRVLGIPICLDEVIVERVLDLHKAWKTVGEPRLLLIGAYRMGGSISGHATAPRT
jgi:hypothetical protein